MNAEPLELGYQPSLTISNGLDDVYMYQVGAVPEPGTIALFGTAIVELGLFRRLWKA